MKEEVDKHEHVYEMRNEVKKKFMIKNLSGGLWACVGGVKISKIPFKEIGFVYFNP